MTESAAHIDVPRLGPFGASIALHVLALALFLAFPVALGAGRFASTGTASVAVTIVLDGSSLALSDQGGRMTGGASAASSATSDVSRRQSFATDDGREGDGRSDDNGDLEASIARAVAGDGASAHYYSALVRQRLASNQRAPIAQPRSGGLVRIKLRVERDGRVDAAWVTRRSGSAALDNAAIQAVFRASPLPPVPNDLPAPFEIEAPIAFGARQSPNQIEMRLE